MKERENGVLSSHHLLDVSLPNSTLVANSQRSSYAQVYIQQHVHPASNLSLMPVRQFKMLALAIS